MKFEIGHVLFIDIVGYSKLLLNEQKERLANAERNRAGTDQFRDRLTNKLVAADRRWRGARFSRQL